MVVGARAEFETAQRAVYVLGPDAEVVLIRPAGARPVEREFALEFGLTPLPGVGPCRLTLTDQHGVVLAVPDPGASRVTSVRLRARAGRNTYRLQVRPTTGLATADRDLLLLQALSLERMENAAP